MNFFESQNKARKNTRIMIVLFLLAMLLIVASISGSVWLIAHFVTMERGDLVYISMWAGVISCLIILIGSGWKIFSLRGGGDSVAQSLGGSRVVRSSKDWHHRRLFNVVEEMAIASGISMPHVYVLENEKSINAFAAGFSANAAAVAVTRGTLEKLNREELQAVVAHEFSHILNGDMRLNIILMGVLHGLFVISSMGYFLMRLMSSSRGARDARGRGGGLFILILLGFAMYVLGYIGIFFGRLIKAFVSRQREFLADASAVQFTRQTEGISGALQKIAATTHGSFIRDRAKSEEMSHMFFGAGDKMSGWLDTHPPILQRIRKVDRNFKPYMIEEKRRMWAKSDPDGKTEDDKKENKNDGKTVIEDIIKNPTPLIMALPVLLEPETSPKKISNNIGVISDDSIENARRILKEIPSDIHDDVMDSINSLNLILSFVDGKIDLEKYPHIKKIISNEKISKYKERMDGISNRLYIPILNLAISSLRDLDKKQLRDLLRISTLVRRMEKTSLLDYCFAQLLSNHIRGWLIPTGQNHNKNLGNSKEEVVDLLRTVSYYSHGSESEAMKSFEKAYRYVYHKSPVRRGIKLNKNLAELDNTWFTLKRLNEESKKILIESLVVAIVEDGEVLAEEEKLLRLVCAILECPIPSVLSD